jgi:hypothetical protein
MGTKRLLAAVAAASVAAIAPLSATIASAAEPTGVGTGSVSSTLLQVDVGDDGSILSVRVLGDDGTSTIDPAKGAPASATSMTPLTISSGVVPALNVTSPSVSTSSSGAEDNKTVSPELPSVPAFSGSLTATLSSIVDTLGARSGLDATLSNLNVAGGLLDVPKATAALGTNAATGEASGTRSISIPSIEVLNLGAVLKGLGLPLGDLPLGTLVSLLGGLGVPLPNISDPAEVVASVNAALASLEGKTGPLTTAICGQVDQVLGTIGGLAGTVASGTAADEIVDTVDGGGGTTLPTVPDLLSAQALPVTCDAVTGTIEDLVDSLEGIVGSVVTSILATLDNTSLLSVQGIEIGLVSNAKSTVETSLADVTGTIGSVKVGSLALPGLTGLDLTAAAGVLSAAGDTVSAAVGDVLALVNAQLADMVDVDVLEIDRLVAPDGEYATATAAVTALTATLTPPALLTGALDITGTAAELLGQVGAAVPALAPVMGQLEASLGGLDLLTSPTTITVGHLSSTSAFRPTSVTVPGTTGGELPRTGSDAAIPAIAAVLVAGVALGIRRFVASISA